ncbi:acyltransferase [Rhizobium sp. CG4]|uniref:acyltransferase family protein n=1 Tax=Rhizobium sp. CG4 TaxID=2726075 RepID=UPI00203436BA|nr:acyltransferase [Rhizobium sp. CG4]MCM2455293.1 acyltransferase [Rhizobium sp. CG4]
MLQATDEKLAVQRDTKHTKTISLQWLRGVAALMVVVYHASIYLSRMNGSSWGLEIVPSWFGAVGVSLFFALSGYLMARMMNKVSAGSFLLHRIIRIYPTYFFVIAVFLLVGTFSGLTPPIDIRALMLMPLGTGILYPLGVEWTLVFEIAFYVFVFFLILFKRQEHAASFLVGWLVLIFIMSFRWPEDPTTNFFKPSHLPFTALNVAFAAGMLLPLLKRFDVPHPILSAIIAVGLFLLGVSNGIFTGRFAIGVASGLFVLSLARHPILSPYPGKEIIDKIGDRLGGYTYALYLVHVPVIRTVLHVSDFQNPAHAFVAAVVLSVAVGVAVGELDLFAYEKLKAKADRLPEHIKLIGSLSFVGGFIACAVTATFWS